MLSGSLCLSAHHIVVICNSTAREAGGFGGQLCRERVKGFWKTHVGVLSWRCGVTPGVCDRGLMLVTSYKTLVWCFTEWRYSLLLVTEICKMWLWRAGMMMQCIMTLRIVFQPGIMTAIVKEPWEKLRSTMFRMAMTGNCVAIAS